MQSRCSLVALVLGISLVMSCDLSRSIQNTTDKAIAAIEGAIQKLEGQSTAWQATLGQLEKELVADAQSTLANEVNDLMSRGIAKAGVELRCDIDFVGRRMKQGLERMLARLTKKPIPPVKPAFCQVVPTAIDLRLAPDRLGVVEFYGYDLDAQSSPVSRAPIQIRGSEAASTTTPNLLSSSAVRVVIKEDGGNEIAVPATKISMPTHYMMTINVSEANGINFSDKAEQLIIRAGTTTLSTLAIIQKPAPTACGAANQRCCGSQDAKPPCSASLECVGGTCRAPPCGGLGQPKCSTGTPCQGGLSDIQGVCKQMTLQETTEEGCGESVMRWASVNGYVSISKSQTKSFYVEQGGDLRWHCGTTNTNDRTGCPTATNWVRVTRDSDRDVEVRCYQVTP